MKLLFKALLTFTIILIETMDVHAQSISLTASKTTGDPGDTIVFKYSYNLGDKIKDRMEIAFDGAGLDRTDVHGGTVTADGEFTWKATPGTHTFRYHLRTNFQIITHRFF